jgi:hypothetical protein
VNKSRATVAFNPNEGVNHASEEKQNERSRAEAARKLTALEAARQESIAPVMPTDGPDFKFRGGGYAVKPLPLNADEGAREDVPVLVYPELSSVGGQLEGYKTHPTAGLGDTFGPGVNPKADIEGLKFMSLPLPKSFFEAIVTTHVATQEVDYLPQALNLPTARNVGRVKPRSAAADWLAIQFDPWSAGKSPLNVEYVASLSSKEHEFQGTASTGKPTTHVADGSKPDKGKDKKDLQMRESIQSMQQRITKDAFINVEDDEGLAKVPFFFVFTRLTSSNRAHPLCPSLSQPLHACRWSRRCRSTRSWRRSSRSWHPCAATASSPRRRTCSTSPTGACPSTTRTAKATASCTSSRRTAASASPSSVSRCVFHLSHPSPWRRHPC